MGFFGTGDGGAADGGLPDWFDPDRELSPVARERLERTARSGVGASTLSAKEFAALGSMGPQPISEVLGACAYRLGTQRLPAEAGYAGEDYSIALHTLNDAWSHARRLAFERLNEEALALGADAVLGVHLRRAERGWTERGIDYSVIGTAVRFPRPERSSPDEGERSPLLSGLSVQDCWTLRAAGYDPAGLVAATAVIFVSQGLGTRWRRRRTMIQNQELIELSDAFSGARHMAVRDLRDQAKRLGAEGVVGVCFACDHAEREFRVDPRVPASTSAATTMLSGESVPSAGSGDKRKGVVFTVHVVGTAIHRRPAAAPPGAPIALTMRLNERRAPAVRLLSAGVGSRRARGQSAVGDEPTVLLASDRRDALVVAVVVNDRHGHAFGCGRDEKVGRRNATVLGSSGQQKLDLPRPAPQRLRHGNRFKGRESSVEFCGAF